MPHFTGIHHLALTVSDLDRSTDFYQTVFGYPPAFELDGESLHRRLFALPGGTNLGLTQHEANTTALFSPFRAGMDHVGFAVESREELIAWSEHLNTSGIENSGIVEAPYGAALSFKDPDHIALEFFVSA